MLAWWYFAVSPRSLAADDYDGGGGAAMKAKQCDECRHFYIGAASRVPENLIVTKELCAFPGCVACLRGHCPRFYVPQSETDDTWGWKRRCDDFKEVNDE